MKKRMPIKIFYGLCFVLFCAWIIFKASSPFDSDVPFIVATGRYIINNGIPANNPFVIDDFPFVIQQWGWDVIIAFMSDFGMIGMCIFMTVLLVFLFLLVRHFFKLRKHHVIFAYLAFVMISYLSVYFFSLRPQLVTIIILFIEVIALEHYKKSGNAIWLIFLPVTMLLQMNLHMSMWPVNFAIILAYSVPSFYYKKLNQDHILSDKKRVIPFCVSIVATIGVMFINPYGLDGILFVIKSLLSNMTDYVSVGEHARPTILSSIMFIILMCAGMAGLCLKSGFLHSVSANMFLGFTCLMISANHSCMFFSFMFVYLLSDFLDFAKTRDVLGDWQKDVCNYLYFLFLPVFTYFTFVFVMHISSYVDTDLDYTFGEYWDGLYDIVNYLDENTSKDAHIYAGYTPANYLEYRGYTNLYMDARPESYTASLTSGKDLLYDYSKYAGDGYDVHDKSDVDRDSVKNWLDSYAFEYIIIMNGESTYLHGYLDGSDDYEKVSVIHEDIDDREDDIDTIFLYHKK